MLLHEWLRRRPTTMTKHIVTQRYDGARNDQSLHPRVQCGDSNSRNRMGARM
jgi:hypothetical protein